MRATRPQIAIPVLLLLGGSPCLLLRLVLASLLPDTGVATAQLLPDRSLEILGVTLWERRLWVAYAIPSGAETVAGDGAPADPSGFIACDGYTEVIGHSLSGHATGRRMLIAPVTPILYNGQWL